MNGIRPHRPHPSYTCRHCGEEIGYLGRLMEPIMPVMFRHVCVNAVIDPVTGHVGVKSTSPRTLEASAAYRVKQMTDAD